MCRAPPDCWSGRGLQRLASVSNQADVRPTQPREAERIAWQAPAGMCHARVRANCLAARVARQPPRASVASPQLGSWRPAPRHSTLWRARQWAAASSKRAAPRRMTLRPLDTSNHRTCCSDAAPVPQRRGTGPALITQGIDMGERPQACRGPPAWRSPHRGPGRASDRRRSHTRTTHRCPRSVRHQSNHAGSAAPAVRTPWIRSQPPRPAIVPLERKVAPGIIIRAAGSPRTVFRQPGTNKRRRFSPSAS